MTTIHPTAIIEDGAMLGAGVEVGPYCHISSGATLEDSVRLLSHVVVGGETRIGAGTLVHPFAALGLPPQHAHYRGERVRLEIGANNVIRENVTMHAGTPGGGGVTRVGSGGMFMINSHVAHDCTVGDGVVFANNATLAGHVEVGDGAFLGGQIVIHQRTRVGAYAFLGGMAGLDADLIPYGIVRGAPAYLAGLNIIGLRRRGFSRERIQNMRRAYKMLFLDPGSMEERLARAEAEFGGDSDVKIILDFLRTPSKRPLCTPHRHRMFQSHDGG
jgi:UDP-N-acetylglucosamine acyltransferase